MVLLLHNQYLEYLICPIILWYDFETKKNWRNIQNEIVTQSLGHTKMDLGFVFDSEIGHISFFFCIQMISFLETKAYFTS